MSKIIIITNDLELGGIQKSLIDFLKYLTGSDQYEIDLVLWQKDGDLKEQLPLAVNVIQNEYIATWKKIAEANSSAAKLKLFGAYLKFSLYAKIVKKPWLYYPKVKKQYDIAIAYSQNGYPRFYTVDNVSATKKFLWYHHGSYDSTKREFELDQKYFEKYDKIITVSESNKKMLTEHFPQFENHFFVVPNLIASPEILLNSGQKVMDFKIEDGIFNFVTVSRFSKEKGIDLAIAVAKKLKKYGLKFRWYFIGQGETLDEITSEILKNQLENNCILLGSKKNPYPYMKGANLYIQTSYIESQSLTVYEALVLKKMIVATNLPALREALQDGELGILCEPNADDFVEKIIRILSDKNAQHLLEKAIEDHTVSNEKGYEAINELL